MTISASQSPLGTKKLTIIKGRGTKAETRIETDITLYWCERLQMWVTIPE